MVFRLFISRVIKAAAGLVMQIRVWPHPVPAAIGAALETGERTMQASVITAEV
jgi:hypothetical protein